MITIKTSVTYNGKEYSDLGKAVRQSATDQIITIVEKKIEPFREEINSSGGSVTIDVSEDLSSLDLKIKNLPDSLADKIKNAFK